MTNLKAVRKFLGFFFDKVSASDQLNDLTLANIELPKPTVDGETFVKLEKMVDKKLDWSRSYGDPSELLPVKTAISSLVKTNKYYLENFDFKLIQSFSSSKGFMRINEDLNTSKYDTALEWGLNMWAGDNLAFTSEEDFRKNINHLKKEGIGPSGEINIHIYEWHDNRILWSNTGGSHHAAALIRQMHEQNRAFYCKANITEYKINNEALSSIANDFHLIIAEQKCLKNNHDYYLGLAFNDIGIIFSDCSMPMSINNYRLFAIPKKQKSLSANHLNEWLNKNIKNKKMIDLYEFIKKPKEAKVAQIS